MSSWLIYENSNDTVITEFKSYFVKSKFLSNFLKLRIIILHWTTLDFILVVDIVFVLVVVPFDLFQVFIS